MPYWKSLGTTFVVAVPLRCPALPLLPTLAAMSISCWALAAATAAACAEDALALCALLRPSIVAVRMSHATRSDDAAWVRARVRCRPVRTGTGWAVVEGCQRTKVANAHAA